MSAYYNEIEPYCVEWLKALMNADLIADGVVDSRPIQEVRPEDLDGFTQCHFFAGLGGWAYAARLAGWPDERELWTGSCPCQPFSVAGKRRGADDPRHLWPYFLPLIGERRPAVVMGEQTPAKAGYCWFDGVRVDLAAKGYTSRAVDIPACTVNSPQIRNRLYWVACPSGIGGWSGLRQEATILNRDGVACSGSGDGLLGGSGGPGLPFPQCEELRPAGRRKTRRAVAKSSSATSLLESANIFGLNSRSAPKSKHEGGGSFACFGGHWDHWQIIGPDRKGFYRRVRPGVRLLAARVPARVAKLRAFGNAIVPWQAAEVIRAWMEVAIG